MFIKYQEELTKPFKEAMAFLKKIENQLGALTKGTIRTSSLGKHSSVSSINLKPNSPFFHGFLTVDQVSSMCSVFLSLKVI
jgi:hypothetical protein